MKVLCIYHGNCADGFTAAWVLKQYFPDAEFFAATHGGPMPEVSHDTHVFMVDFMPKVDVVMDMAGKVASLLILDHHVTAKDAYNGAVSSSAEGKGVVDFIRVDHSIDTWKEHVAGVGELGTLAFIYADDMSGAGLAWEFFFPRNLMPKLVSHVQDRDLWRFRLPHTREFQSYLFSHEYTFENWDRIAAGTELSSQYSLMLKQGEAIDRKAAKDIQELLKVCKRSMEIAGYSVPVASLPYTMVSDAAQAMYQQEGTAFAACYWDTPDGRVFGLRSPKDGADVGYIAKQYGGGGHKHAAGFTVGRDHILARS